MKKPDHPLVPQKRRRRPMLTHLQTSHRLMSLPLLIKANYWTLSRTTMTSTGMRPDRVNPETADEIIRVNAKTKKEASKRSFERIVRRSFQFTGSLKLPIYWKLPKLKNKKL
jgi:hypothetical protein